MSQTARGLAKLLAKCASDVVPTAFSLTSSATAFADLLHHALVLALQEAAHHVRSHSAEANHSELHGLALPGEADGSSDREAATPAIRASRTR